MPFSQDDTDRIKASLQTALASPSLSEWQRDFLTNMQSRFEKYGPRTRLSDKQYAKLKQILAGFDTQASQVAQKAERPRPKPVVVKPHPAARTKPRARRQSSSPLKTVRKVRRSMRDVMLIVAAILAVLAGIGSLFESGGSQRITSSQSSKSSQVYRSARDFSITDGDTVQIHGMRKGTRLVGFNTPETYKPQCSQELALGHQATDRLKSLVQSSNTVELRLVRCACPSGTQGTDACNFGRSCGVLRVDGHDVGDILIAEGLAVRFQCGATSCPRMPRPWCG